MRKIFGVIFGALVVMMGMSMVTAPRVVAAECDGIRTSVLGDNGCVGKEDTDDGTAIFSVLNIVLQILTYGIGIAGTFAIVITGIQYMTAKDNAGQMAVAKTRLIAIVIGLAVYAVMWGFLQWLLPGGIFAGN